MPDNNTQPPTPPELDDPFDELDPIDAPVTVPTPAPPAPEQAPLPDDASSPLLDRDLQLQEIPAVPVKEKREEKTEEQPKPQQDTLKTKKPKAKRQFPRLRMPALRLPVFLTTRRVMIVLVFILVCAGIVIAASQFLMPEDSTSESSIDQLLSDPEPVTATPEPQGSGAADADGDGLLDDEEATLGTDPNKVDTDEDGLSDRQEIRIYQTNPRDPDSDNDGFDDGEEVRGFYNPNGSGTMIDVEEEIEQFENQQ